MKKLLFLSMVAGAFAFTACGGSTESTEAAAGDTVVEAPIVDEAVETVVDGAEAVVDSTAGEVKEAVEEAVEKVEETAH